MKLLLNLEPSFFPWFWVYSIYCTSSLKPEGHKDLKVTFNLVQRKGIWDPSTDHWFSRIKLWKLRIILYYIQKDYRDSQPHQDRKMLISYRLHLQWVLFVFVFLGVLNAGSLCLNSPLHDPPKNSTGTDSGEGVQDLGPDLGWVWVVQGARCLESENSGRGRTRRGGEKKLVPDPGLVGGSSSQGWDQRSVGKNSGTRVSAWTAEPLATPGVASSRLSRFMVRLWH